MRFQKQLFRHNPEQGVWGDCARTVYACFLDLHPSEVPHFAELHWNDGEAWDRAVAAFLQQHGCREIMTAWSGDSGLEGLAGIHAFIKGRNPGLYYMLSGGSRNGTNHVVICCDGEIVWDPAQDDSGIVGPGDDGHFWINYLTCNRFTKDSHAAIPHQ